MEKPKKVGDKINIGGIPITVVPQEEIDKNAEEITFVCVPCKWGPSGVPGSTKAVCGKCKDEVWISPATKASHPAESPIRCIPCVTKEIEESKE